MGKVTKSKMTRAELRAVLGIPSLRQMRAARRRATMALPRETRQAFMDRIHAGETIGAAGDAMGISLDNALEILNMNMRVHKYITFREVSL